MKSLGDLEDELKNEHTRNEKRNRERVEDIERNYDKSIRKYEEKSTEAVEDIRETANNSSLRSREADRVEMERLKGYDRNGRSLADAEDHKAQIDTLKTNVRQQQEQGEQRLSETEKSYEKRLEDQGKEYNERMEKAVQSARDSASASLHETIESRKAESKDAREEFQKKYEVLNRQRIADQQFAQAFTEKSIDGVHRDYENREFHSDLATEQRLNKTKAENAKALETNSRTMRNARDNETRDLRNQLDDLVQTEGQLKTDRALAASNAVRDYEDFWRSRERLQAESHARELEGVKAGSNLAEHIASRKQEGNLNSRDAHFTRLVKDQVIENRDAQKDIEREFGRVEKQLNHRNEVEKNLASITLDQQLHKAHADRQVALEEQAVSFQNAMRTQHSLDRDRIKTLEKEITAKNSTADPTQISPAAEATVRRNVTKEYEKTLNAETERNRRSQEALQRSFSEKFVGEKSENAMTTTRRENQNQLERHMEKSVLMDALQDTEYQKETALRSKEGDHERQSEQLLRSFAQSNTRQRNEYESLLQSTKDDAAARISVVRQESEFASKTAQRAFANRQNELIREYEKKLTAQKLENELRTEEQRNQTQLTLKESERRSKQALDEMTRGYEHRLVQTQAQQKERERLIAQNYEDELEKVKRTNALIQQKKS